jgi:hypothetical protein
MPTRRVIRRPITPVSARWPNHYRLQIRAVSTDALDSCHCRSLDARTPVSPHVGFAYKDLHGTEHREYNSGLVHIIYVFSHDCRILQNSANHAKLVFDLCIGILIVTILVYRLNPPRYKFRTALLEGFDPVLARRLKWPVRQGPIASGAERYEGYVHYSHGSAELGHLQDEIHYCLLFKRSKVLLALGFLFDRPTAVGTVVEGRAGDSAMICDSTI